MDPIKAAGKLTTRAAYAAGQALRVAWFTGHYVAGRHAMGPLTEPGEAPYADEFEPLDRDRLSDAYRELFKADWRNIKAGEYRLPREVRRIPNPATLLRQSRDYFADTRAVSRRKATRQNREVFAGEARENYPGYYLQNFHYQSDGWLSDASAERYDMQVETLFTGAAAAMRRQALPLLRRVVAGRSPRDLRLLDLGAGAGTFLGDVLDNWPSLQATALDLSPNYLAKARIALDKYKQVEFLRRPAEETGLADASQDIVSAVYLFHELPPKVRVEVATEIARVLKPGGAFIIVDTLQYGDDRGLDILLENFPRGFHEPYYDSFCRTNLDDLFGAAGLSCDGDPVCAFLTKCVLYRKAV
jgi:ubiquinone/menaquinone biosynthesis C-methylase UbiE